jgi:hypothetical protein
VLDHLNKATVLTLSLQYGSRSFPLPNPFSPARHTVCRRCGPRRRHQPALLEAIAGADRERPTIIIFLTDGLPTSGEVETPRILANVEQAAGSNLRIFPFGVGDDVDTVLLDTLAQEERGTTAYVRPGERVDEQVGSFYAKVSTPVLADISPRWMGCALRRLSLPPARPLCRDANWLTGPLP